MREMVEQRNMRTRQQHERDHHQMPEYGNPEHGNPEHGMIDREHRDHADHEGGRDHEHHEDHQRDHGHHRDMPLEERIELLRIAFDHLNEAGMQDLADETRRRGEELERQREHEHGHKPENAHLQHLLEESHRAIHALNQRLDQVQRELQEMRGQLHERLQQR